jgi:curved DNA-binding protein
MQFKDYYEVMGVARDATQDEIKRAYRKLARKYHPDVSKEPDAERRFKEVGEAYEVLKDPEKRAAYDQLGNQWKDGQDFRPPPGWDANFEFSGGGFTGGDASAFSDFFESLFGQAGRSGWRTQRGGTFHMRGEDHHAKILIDVEDAYNGATRTVTLKAPGVARDGHVKLDQHTLNIRIPKGVRAGQQIRLAGQGAPGMGQGGAGDLYLEVEFAPHPLYRVDGRDVYVDLPVAPWEAALGARVDVPTPDGKVTLKVPEGSGQGRKLRLSRRGIPGKPPGDLYVVLRIALPPAHTEQERAAYRKLSEAFSFNPRAAMEVRR